MKGKKTVSLADDRRARVPFALVAVVLLTTSIVTVGVLLDRSTPEIDVSPDLVHERTTMAAESVISNAVSDAITQAGQEPVTEGYKQRTDQSFDDPGYTINPGPQYEYNEIGAALASGDANEDEIFERYVKLRIYITVNNRLENIEQTVSGQHGVARGHAALPELSNDEEAIEDAIDRVTLEIGTGGSGGEGVEQRFSNTVNELERGEYRVAIDGVEHTVSTDGHQIHSEEQSYNTTGETAVFEMHSQVMEYQERLDDTVEDMLYARIYPLLYGKMMWENVMAPHMLQAASFPQMIQNQELEVHTNAINYRVQQSVFGTTDDGYPTVMNTANGCLAQILAGQLAAGAAGRAIPIPLGVDPLGYPGEEICYFMMYAELDQASTTATTDIPAVSEFVNNESDWESQGDLFEPIPGAAEGVEDFHIDIENINHDDLTEGELDIFSDQMDQQTPGSDQEIEIDSFANQVYIDMFDKDEDHFDDSTEVNSSDINSSLPEDAFPGDESATVNSSSVDDVTRAQKDDIDQLRQQLIEDVDPVEVSRIQLLTADDVFGEMIYEIEQNADEYVYSGGNYPGLRNGYLQRVIDALESVEEGRKEAAEELDDELGDESLEELLIKGEAAIEGELDSPEGIEEIADDQARESEGPGVDRFDIDNASRDSYVWWDDEDGGVTGSRFEEEDENNVSFSYPVLLDDDGVPETVYESMLFQFGDGGLPRFTEEATSVTVSTAAGDGPLAPTEISSENRTDAAYSWNIRAIDLDKNIYRMTNEQLVNRTLPSSDSEGRTYIQVTRIDDEKMDLTDGAERYIGENMYTITSLNVTRKETQSSEVDVDGEELAAPDLRPADNENFEFDIRASPNYLSGMPITRDIEPAIRAPAKGPTNPRNSLFAPYSSRVINNMPNPGVPIIPVPKFWIASANHWQTDVKTEYARFELHSNRSTGLEVGSETYARQDMVVEFDIDGESVPAGSVEPISIEATNHFPMMAPGRLPSRRMADAIPSIKPPIPSLRKFVRKFLGPGSWGTGNNLNLMSIGVPLVPEWTPHKCTAGWPDVGAGVDPTALDRGCADWGPIGQAINSPLVLSSPLQISVLTHVAGENQDDEREEHIESITEELDETDSEEGELAEELGELLEEKEELEVEQEERERIDSLCTAEDIATGECSTRPRDRDY